MGLLGGFIIDQFGNNVASVFFIAGIVNLISVFLVLRVETNVMENRHNYKNEESEYDVVDNLEEIDECNKESTSDEYEFNDAYDDDDEM